MTLLDRLLRFRKSVWFRVLYVAILALLLTALLPTPPISWLLVPVTLLVVPYWLRERGYRRYIVNGLVALIGSMMILAVWSAATVAGRAASPVVGGGVPGVELSNGTVTPFSGPTTANYTFSVDIRTSTQVSTSAVQVWLNLSFVDLGFNRGSLVRPLLPLNTTDANFVDGKRYQLRTSLGSSTEYVYFFGFSALVNLSAIDQVFAGPFSDIGPVVGGFWTYFLFVWAFAPNLLVPPAILYFVLLGVHRLRKRSRTRQQRVAAMPPPAAAAPSPAGDRYTCTNCGKEVAEDAPRCPSCGAVFDEEPEMPPAERVAPSKEERDQAR